MQALRAEEHHVADARALLGAIPELAHLRARRRAEFVVIESGPADDPIKHARLRRVAVHLWTLDAATHRGQWQPTGLRGRLDQLINALVADFGWLLTPIA